MKKKASHKRKFPRPGLMAPVDLELTEERSSIEAYTVNVSYQGFALYCPTPLSLKTKVNAKILFVDGHGHEVIEKVHGSVIWCRPVGRLFGIGLKNQVLDSKKHPILLEFIKQTEILK